MKQFDIKKELDLGNNRYYIRPFGAFVAANLSGELAGVITPIIGSLAPLASGGDLMDLDISVAAPALVSGFSSLSGDKIEAILHKLLTKHKNITVEIDGADAQTLTDDLVNELFCGDAQDMFVLAFEVIKVNYSGFFDKLSTLSGEVK